MTNLISFVYIIFEKKSLLFPNLVVWTFFTYVRACRASNTTNTAQQGAIRPAQSRRNQACPKQQSKYVPTRARQRKQQTELTRASLSSSVYTARCVLKTNEEIPICPAKIYNHTHKAAEAGVMLEGLACISNLNKVQHCSFSPSFLCISYMPAASGLFSWSMELGLLQVVSLHLKSWTFLSASFVFCSIPVYYSL